MTERLRVEAPAKINLALHVTGQRADGYHTLETIAVFADVGDFITAELADRDAFDITGPEAAALAGEDPQENLVLRARDLLRSLLSETGIVAPPVAMTLEKHLPAGSGIGGGSADAAATLRALTALWDCRDISGKLAQQAAALGADVPMCLHGEPLVASGIGETIAPLANLPALAVVLVNPRRHVSTPAVFSKLVAKNNPPLPLGGTTSLRDASDWAAWLKAATRNDLQAPSVSLTPDIEACLAALEGTGTLLTRMSGSGATRFSLYDGAAQAEAAAMHLLRRHPDWWIKSCMTGPSAGAPA
ncbi:MAG: 4-(cytidine 5'-diphospho)-2-C-methyl-D-erythritol kinase [Ahrensia sp.]|nr:4-(cytidine 5'-diphospho)-2-C-methyl-D-erythritol kinase [Ahrensia sp.]